MEQVTVPMVVHGTPGHSGPLMNPQLPPSMSGFGGQQQGVTTMMPPPRMNVASQPQLMPPTTMSGQFPSHSEGYVFI